MEVLLTASRNLPTAFRCRIEISKSQRHPVSHSFSLYTHSHYQKLAVTCSIKVPTAGHFNRSNKITTYLKILSESLWKSFPEPVKEFPLKKGEDMVLQRLLHIGKKTLKWSLVALFIVSFISDVIFSISRDRELMIPLGLFIGITVADFLKETSQELFRSSTKDSGVGRHLLGIGFFFVFIKCITPYVTLPGRVILSHVGNGGLMQVLWLARRLQEAVDDVSEEQLPSSSQLATYKD